MMALLGALGLLLGLSSLALRLARAILVSDLAESSKFDQASSCLTRCQPLSNQWKCLGWSRADVRLPLEVSWSLVIGSALIKEFDWSKLLFFLVLTVDFLSFSISFFIVKKMLKLSNFDCSSRIKILHIARPTWMVSPARSASTGIIYRVGFEANFWEIGLPKCDADFEELMDLPLWHSLIVLLFQN